MEVDRVLEELANIAFVDPLDIFNEDGTIKDLHKIPAHARKAISNITIRELYRKDGIHEGAISNLKLESKLKALELLGKHMSMFSDKLKLEPGDKPIEHVHKVESVDLKERIQQIVEDRLSDALR